MYVSIYTHTRISIHTELNSATLRLTSLNSGFPICKRSIKKPLPTCLQGSEKKPQAIKLNPSCLQYPDSSHPTVADF